MSLPPDATRLASITGFLTWRRAVEKALTQLQTRAAATGLSRVGTIVTWAGSTSPLPAGMLPADGSTVAQADHPALFNVIGTTYNTGGEAAGTFRLPSATAPSVGVAVIYG